MSDRKPVPSEPKAFKGSKFASGATRWMTPITIVPWPNAAYAGFPSRMATEDWSRIATLDWLTLYFVVHVEGVQGGWGEGKSVGDKSLSSEAPCWLRVKS